MRLLVDSNIIIDFVLRREPFYVSARKLLVFTALGELEAWVGASQLTDVFYVLTSKSGGMDPARAKALLRTLRERVHVCSLTQADVDAALASTWDDFEDACVHQSALKLKADAIVTRNKEDFERSFVPVLDCEELFALIEKEHGIVYGEVELGR